MGSASSPPQRSPAAAAVAGVYVLLVFAALHDGLALDFLPSYAAAGLVLEGRSDAIYLLPDAPHLFASPQPLLEAAVEATRGRATPEDVTAFVSSPASLLFVLPFAALPYGIASILWRLGLVFVAIVCLRDCSRRRLSAGSDRGLLWALGLLAAAPLLMYAAMLGQSSLLMLGAAAIYDPDRKQQGAGFRLLVAAAVVFKVFPVVLLGFLLLMRRSRDVLWIAGITALWTLLALAVLPHALFPDFFDGLRAVGARVTTEWNNFGVEALLLRLGTGTTTPWFQDVSLPIRAAASAARVCAFVAAGFAIATGRGGGRAQWGAAWAATITLSPMLWAHYLVVLPVLLLERNRFEAAARALILAGCGGWLLLRASGAIELTSAGNLGGVLWLASAGVLLAQAWWQPDGPSPARLRAA